MTLTIHGRLSQGTYSHPSYTWRFTFCFSEQNNNVLFRYNKVIFLSKKKLMRGSLCLQKLKLVILRTTSPFLRELNGSLPLSQLLFCTLENGLADRNVLNLIKLCFFHFYWPSPIGWKKPRGLHTKRVTHWNPGFFKYFFYRWLFSLYQPFAKNC